jgi:hypothetical protein
MSNYYLNYIIGQMRSWLKKTNDPAKKEYIRHLIDMQERGIDIEEKKIKEAWESIVRNPGFLGDMVGRPDDDFEADDDEGDHE